MDRDDIKESGLKREDAYPAFPSALSHADSSYQLIPLAPKIRPDMELSLRFTTLGRGLNCGGITKIPGPIVKKQSPDRWRPVG
jgi:hypothetical protein